MMYWVPILCLSILLIFLCLWLWPRHKLDLQTKQINDELKKEIDAQLSLSSELDYQREVLITYGILDKKTKKMVD